MSITPKIIPPHKPDFVHDDIKVVYGEEIRREETLPVIGYQPDTNEKQITTPTKDGMGKMELARYLVAKSHGFTDEQALEEANVRSKTIADPQLLREIMVMYLSSDEITSKILDRLSEGLDATTTTVTKDGSQYDNPDFRTRLSYVSKIMQFMGIDQEKKEVDSHENRPVINMKEVESKLHKMSNDDIIKLLAKDV